MDKNTQTFRVFSLQLLLKATTVICMIFLEPVLFELPVLPRVQKFIRHKLTDSSGQAHPMYAHPTAFGPGLIIWTMAQTEKKQLFSNYAYRPGKHNQQADRPVSKRVYYDPKFTAQIGVGIAEFHHSRHQYLLNYNELEQFSRLIDYLIFSDVVDFCEARPDVAPMVRIKAFCDQYDFAPGELSEDSLKQMYLRHRRGKSGSNYSRVVVSQFQFVPCPIAA
ncbi:hypothetical protein [Spirosoma harenae]